MTSSSSTTSTTPTSTALAKFCLQDPSTNQFATLWKGGNGLSFGSITKKNFPSLFTLDAQSRLTSTLTGYYAVLNLATFGSDGASQGHVEGVTLDQLSSGNPNYRPLVCDVGTGSLLCRSAANYVDAARNPVMRSQVLTTTQGNDGVDRYVFAPTSVVGAAPVRVLPASACGPNYS
ncbi:MAG: hypothetical protein Q9184_008307 [Pyrenodesmia sp. 2 TL-2023]